MDDVIPHINPMLNMLLVHCATNSMVLKWTSGIAKQTYTSEVALLSSQKHGLHYMTHGMTEEKLKSFDIKGISILMLTTTPCMWELLGELLAADTELSAQCMKLQKQAEKKKSEAKQGNKSQGADKDMQQDIHPEETEEWTW